MHDHEPEVAPAGSGSVTMASVAVDGPVGLPTTIEYVTLLPGTVDVAAPSVLLIVRSARGVATPVAVAVLFSVFVSTGAPEPLGPATVAVLESVPVNDGDSVAVIANVAMSPRSRFTVVLMLPVPVPAAHVDPVEGVQVHEMPVRPAGNVSVTEIAAVPVRGNGPLFVTTTEYDTAPPGTSGDVLRTLLTLTSMHCEPVLTPGTCASERVRGARAVRPAGGAVHVVGRRVGARACRHPSCGCRRCPR